MSLHSFIQAVIIVANIIIGDHKFGSSLAEFSGHISFGTVLKNIFFFFEPTFTNREISHQNVHFQSLENLGDVQPWARVHGGPVGRTGIQGMRTSPAVCPAHRLPTAAKR